jgi:hypothetical protein
VDLRLHAGLVLVRSGVQHGDCTWMGGQGTDP